MTSSSRTQPWPDLASHYAQLALRHGPALDPLHALVQFLAGSRYAHSLFARPDGDALCLGRRRDFAPGEDELQIRFDPAAQRFTFSHLQRPGEAEPWSRVCEAEQARQVLERLFHRRLQWFHEG